MPLVTTLNLAIKATLTGSGDLATPAAPMNTSYSHSLANGTGANQSNQIFSDQRTIGASGSEELDLAGTLTNLIGATITFTKVKAIIVKAAAANTNDVVIGGAAVNGFYPMFGAATETVKVKPGGMFAITAPDANGYAVTAATADLLKIANSGAGTGVTYDIIIIGVQ